MGSGRRQDRIGLLWVIAVVLSCYAAEDLQGWLRTSGLATEHPVSVARASAWLVGAARWTGLGRLHDALEGAVATMPATLAVHAAKPGVALAATAPAAATIAAVAPRRMQRVLIVGASTIQFHLGAELERELRRRYPALELRRLGKLSTGLTRPDVFDWPATLRELTTTFHPDLVIANFGGNDGQGMVLPGGAVATYGTGPWEAAYRDRVRDIVAIGRAAGAEVLMLGMSTTRDPVLCRRMARINVITEAAAAEAGGAFLSIWDLGAGPDGRFQDVVSIAGVPTRTRLADGKHLSRAGAVYVAAEVSTRLAARYTFASGPGPEKAGISNASQR